MIIRNPGCFFGYSNYLTGYGWLGVVPALSPRPRMAQPLFTVRHTHSVSSMVTAAFSLWGAVLDSLDLDAALDRAVAEAWLFGAVASGPLPSASPCAAFCSSPASSRKARIRAWMAVCSACSGVSAIPARMGLRST